ncbi:hypothetical protein QBC37DRAFT_32278 [Rhypophila decipiens]|uniref:Uncharacterized protein n=1 Tax=Rhypophila decipiens TaxID=261697 RepID=A0AAN6YGT0_9PEZI|nr:hypothetical protein QBC37DRAFT_32278 [Rhypophila decipiens]
MAYRVRRQSYSSVQVAGDDDEDYQKWPRARGSKHSADNDTVVNRRGLARSVTAFFSKLRPSKQMGRGFSTRHRNGVRSGPEDGKDGPPSKHILDTIEVHESDIIPPQFWNTAIPIPRRTHSLINGSRIPRKPLPISATRQMQHNKTDPKTNPRQPSATNGLTLDGVSNFLPRKPLLPSPTIQRASSAPSRGTITQAQDSARQLFLAKQEARRQRQNLKESGDFLGVTGFNPQTGEWDILTQTTSSGEGSPREDQHVSKLAEKAREAQAAYERAKKEAQAKKKELKAKDKDTNRLDGQQIKWRREERQWSSAAEPRLSPIPQSSRNSGAAQSNDPTTVKVERGSFLELGAAPEITLTARCRQISIESTESPIPLGTKSMSSQPTPQVETQVPVTSFTQRIRTLRFTVPPTIPRRLGPSQQDTSPPLQENSAMKETHIKLGLENQNPSEKWAWNLLKDLDGLEKPIDTTNNREMKAEAGSIVQDLGGLGTAVGSVCTPTTTITGSALSPRPSNVCGEKDATLQDTPPKAVSTSAPTESPLSETSKNKNSCSSRLAFQPPKQPSAWSSLPNLPLKTAPEPKSDQATTKLGEPEEPKQEAQNRPPSPSSGPDADTTCPRPRTATSASEKPFLAAWLKKRQLKKEIRKTLRPDDHQSVPADSTSPPTSTSTETTGQSSNLKSRSMLISKLGQRVQAEGNGQAMAQGAARLALAPHVPRPASGAGPVSGDKDDKVDHGVDVNTGVEAPADTNSGDGGDRGAAKTVMGAEAGHDDGHADLAGTVSWGPLLTALLGVASADNDYIQDGNLKLLMVIGAQLQQKTDKRQPLSPLIHGDLVLLAENPDQPQDWSLGGDCIPIQLRKALLAVRQLVCAYWELVRPVLDAESPLRQRLAQRQQVTAQDYGICILALLFLILAFSAGAWTIRITMGVFRLIGVLARAILKVILALAGFV